MEKIVWNELIIQEIIDIFDIDVFIFINIICIIYTLSSNIR